MTETVATIPSAPSDLRLPTRLQMYGGRAVLMATATLRRDRVAALLLPRGRAHRYRLYEQLRAQGPMNRSALGFYTTTSHRLVGEILRSRDFGAAPAEGDEMPPGAQMALNLSLLELNPPDHTRLRRVVAPAFTPRRLARFEQLVTETARDLLQAASVSGEPFDLVAHLAAPLPVRVITELLGIPEGDHAAFLRHGEAIAQTLDGVQSMAHARRIESAHRALHAVFERLLAERRADPRDDVLSDIATAGDRVGPDEMVPLASLLLVAGFETTVNLIGNVVVALQSDPKQWRLVVDDPGLAGAAVEETLRYDPPVQLTGRIAHRDIEVGGVEFRRGTQVVPLIGATGRDPEVFSRPATFDLTRTAEADHLAFSAGIHYCLGAPLARMEARVAVAELTRSLPRLTLAGTPTRRDGTTLNGFSHLPVRPG